MAKRSVVLVVVLGLGIGMAYWGLEFLSDLDVMRALYPSYEAAKQDGLFSRGWLPTYIPDSATKIEEVHDLDSNQVCASMLVDSAQISQFSVELTNRDYLRVEPNRDFPASLPGSLRCPFRLPFTDAQAVFRREAPKDEPGLAAQYFAMFEKGSIVYYWSARN